MTEKSTCKSKTGQGKKEKEVIASRKSCKAGSAGTGLSHYILMDKKGK